MATLRDISGIPEALGGQGVHVERTECVGLGSSLATMGQPSPPPAVMRRRG